MTLQAIHDFELALTEPLLAMTQRGLLVNEELRQERIRSLREEIAPLYQQLQDKVAPLLRAAKVSKPHLFVEKWTCPCCRGGAKKSQACWTCAGLEKAPKKKDGVTLGPCANCAGEPRRETFVFNPKSGDQLRIVLYELLKLPKRYKEGTLRTDEEVLKDFVARDKHGVVVAMLTVRKHESMIGHYERIAPGPDGRIRTFYSSATETGRLASSGGKPFPKPNESYALEISTNLQNIPEREAAKNPLYRVKDCLVPDPGEVFVYADLSQAEARVVEALCGNREALEKWATSGYDAHKEMAAWALDKPLAEVTKMERNVVGKTGRHASGYGESWVAFMNSINSEADSTGYAMTPAEAKVTLRRIYQRRHLLGGWWRRVKENLDKTGSITTIFGRRRMFFGRRNQQLSPKWLEEALEGRGVQCSVIREGIAHEPQSTVGDLFNRGILRWWRKYDGKFGRIMAQLHDGGLFSVPKRLERVACKLIRECLEETITVNGIALVIPCEVKTSGKSWGDCE